MKVSQLPHDPGPAAWNAILPPGRQRAALEEHAVADWLVIGAGFAGLSAARRLAELHPGDSIAVLEASSLAEGPAGRNSGFMIDVPHELNSSDYSGSLNDNQRQLRLNRAGIAYALEAKNAFEMPDEAIAQTGKINGAVTSRGIAHNDSYAEHLKGLGEAFDRLGANEMQAITGTDYYQDGLYTAGTVMLQPAMYIRSLADRIESNRLRIYEHSAVCELSAQGSHWCAKTHKGSIVAPKVILCVNGHLQSFGYYPKHLVHVYTYGSLSRKLTDLECHQLGGEPNWALTPADPLGTSVRRITDSTGSRILIRNRATYDPSLSVPAGRIAKVSKTHDRSFANRFPMLAGVSLEYRWGGRLCLSRNKVSAFGQMNTNLYSACCQNGLGTAKGTIQGKLAAELASGFKTDMLDDQMAEDVPQRLPPAPLDTLGAAVKLAWGEHRAGHEL
ncbi:MAG: FAD-binding oxidoreductase [Gammaproteobacteria bacterium]|nr:FAD-binding oxidoreductase [Gammaproteobacteria bacterium]